MTQLFKFRDEFAAHLARATLLEHGIESDVIHDHAATLYGGWLMHPRLLVEDEDVHEAQRILSEAAVPAEEETLTAAADAAGPGENLGLTRAVPGFGSLVLTGLVAGAGLGLLAIFVFVIFSIVAGRTDFVRLTAETLRLSLIPLSSGLAGAVFGACLWPAIRLGLSCRRRADGLLPLHARAVAVLLLGEGGLLLLLGWLISRLTELLRTFAGTAFSAL